MFVLQLKFVSLPTVAVSRTVSQNVSVSVTQCRPPICPEVPENAEFF